MKFQSNRSSCGPAALLNALEALGISRTEDELAKLSKQTPAGTSAQNLIRAIKAISTPESPLHGIPVRYSRLEDAIIGLWYNLTNGGRPVIIVVDAYDHWVVCSGYLGQRFVVIDSADNRLVLYYSPKELTERWLGPNGGYHGIIV